MTKTHEHLIGQTETLAPLKEGMYETQNLGKRDATILTTLSNNLIRNIDQTISQLSSMTNNMKIYREVMVDSINAEAEGIDITTKYNRNDFQGQSHNLPGVNTVPPSYDVVSIKKDQAKFEEIKKIRDATEAQKNMYIKVLDQDFKAFIQLYKKMLYHNNSMSTFILSLDHKTEGF